MASFCLEVICFSPIPETIQFVFISNLLDMSDIMVEDGTGYFPVLESILNNLLTFCALVYPKARENAVTFPFV